MRRVVVYSPHSDDAALCCCDHLRAWRDNGVEALVVTVFCSYRTPIVSEWQAEVVRAAGSTTIEEYEATRQREDIQAMELMQVQLRQWDFTDAAFRAPEGKLLYSDPTSLFSGTVHEHDAQLVRQISDRMREHDDMDLFLVPLGVGQHADHLIVRTAAEIVRSGKSLSFYVDYPYARNPRKWRYGQLLEAVRRKKSIKWTSREKRRILNCYATQIPQFMRWGVPYPEVVLGY